MQDRYPDSRILIFAKAPIPGKVKTRLVGRLTKHQAATIHTTLLLQTVQMALASRLAPVSLYCFPDTSHEVFVYLQSLGVRLEVQTGNELGERMANALKQTLVQARAAVLLGSDCPLMSQSYLGDAFNKLSAHDVVLGPAEDGGYVLVGQSRFKPEMFKGIAWGESNVLHSTRQLLRSHGIDWYELDTLWDVDRPADLERAEVRHLLHQFVPDHAE